MAFVKQRLKRDCGVAAIAMLCDVSYEEARDALPWRYNRRGYVIRTGTTTRMMRYACVELGYYWVANKKGTLILVKKSADPWLTIPNNSLVKVRNPDNYLGWHWVVWKNDKVYDPACGVYSPEQYDEQPSSYMEFVKCTK